MNKGAKRAQKEAEEAQKRLARVNEEAEEARQEAEQARKAAEKAYQEIEQARNEAQKVEQEIKQAEKEAEKASEEMKQAQADTKEAEQEARQANEEAEKAEQRVTAITARKNTLEAPIEIKDLVIIGQHTLDNDSYGTGEYEKGASHNAAEHAEAIIRLQETIGEFVKKVSDMHAINCVGQMMDVGKENHITRLTTNEFLFYTKNPLSLEEFRSLMGEIYKLAEMHPENLHLILGSFSIRVEHDSGSGLESGIINVVPYIECGPNARMNFIVKNVPSPLDPAYKVGGVDLPNWGKSEHPIAEDYTIEINGQNCVFSYKNVIKCRTAGGAEFYTGVNICLDHHRDYEVANKNFKEIEQSNVLNLDELSPTQRWLVITSNSVLAREGICWGRTTYADRRSDKRDEPLKTSRRGLSIESDVTPMSLVVAFPAFTQEYKEKIYQQTACETLLMLEAHNKKVLQKAVTERNTAKANAKDKVEKHEERKLNLDEKKRIEETTNEKLSKVKKKVKEAAEKLPQKEKAAKDAEKLARELAENQTTKEEAVKSARQQAEEEARKNEEALKEETKIAEKKAIKETARQKAQEKAELAKRLGIEETPRYNNRNQSKAILHGYKHTQQKKASLSSRKNINQPSGSKNRGSPKSGK